MKKLIIFILPLFLLACSDNKKTLTGYSGNVGEVIVVCSENTWEGPVGHALRSHFNEVIYGLPQDEPSFELIHFRKQKFQSVIESHRNVVYLTIDANETGTAHKFIKNRFARGQLFLDIRSNHQDSLAKYFEENGSDLAQRFKDIELNRLYLKNKKFGDKEIKMKLEQQMAISLTPQKDLYVEKLQDDLAWLRLERERTKGGYKHQISQGIILFTKEYEAREEFSEDSLIYLCNSVLQAHLPGPTKGSYMQIGTDPVKPISREINFRSNYGREIRGLWYMENSFMGGGFILLVSLDEKRDRIVGSYGYVFAPGFDKREYLREVEAMVKSMDFIE